MSVWMILGSVYISSILFALVIRGYYGFDDGDQLPMVFLWPLLIIVMIVIAPFMGAHWLGQLIRSRFTKDPDHDRNTD